MSNWSPKILWPIDYLSMTSITHWCNWLLIDDPLITHRLLYCARKKLFLLSCPNFFFVCDSFNCVRPIFPCICQVPVDDLEMQSASHQYKWFLIVQFAKLNNLDKATVKCGQTKTTTERYRRTYVPWKMVFPF